MIGLNRLTWQEYHPELYVDRGIIQQTVLNWLSERQPLRPIRSLVGSPGTGKSWLLGHIYHATKGTQFVLWIYAPTLASSNHNTLKLELIEQANAHCTKLNYPSDLTLSFSALVEDIGAQLCEKCSSSRPLVLVDGCDEIAEREDLDRIQRLFLRPFFINGSNGFRMVVATRRGLEDDRLRKKDSPIFLGTFDDKEQSGARQVRYLIEHLYPTTQSALNLETMLPDYCRYPWNHPYINAFLVDQAASNGTITSTDLKRCCHTLMNRPSENSPTRYPPLSQEACEKLVTLAVELPEVWDSDQYRDHTKEVLGEGDSGRYMDQGIIVNVRLPNGQASPNYSIADGFRELLHDLAAMRNKESEL